MAEFTADLQSFRPLFPFLDIDSMELIHQFKTVNSLHVMDNSYFNHMQNLMPFSNSSDNIFGSPEESQFPGTLEENFSVPVSFPISSNDTLEDKKRKATTMDMNETTSVNSTPAVSENKCGKDKRVKRDVTTGKESKEVVHVRAKRGQATDSHSLAERVRRGKINEKFRSLQNIVPGCHKTMGMAIMLDEIINYVQSLQHQVEFLSMKLSAASTFYDFNSEIDAFETMQRERVSETRDYASQGYGGVSSFQPTWL